MSMRSLQQSVAEINAEKVYCTNHATTATTYVFDLAAVVDPTQGSGTKYLCGADGREQPLLVLQCDQDFIYRFSTNASDVVTAATGTFVRAGDQEYARPFAQTNRRYLSVLRSTADGTVKIFKSTAAGQ